jgi:hypothetical protein
MIKNLVGLSNKIAAQSHNLTWIIAVFVLASSTVYSQAPTVNAPTVTGITTTGATLGGTVTGTLTHRGSRWSTTSPVGTSNELEEASTTAGAFTQARTGLPSAARIFFVAYARNNSDVGTTAETTFFTEPLQLTAGQFTAVAPSETAIDLTFPTADSWEGTGATGGYVIFRKPGSAPSLGALADGAAPPADGVGDKIATITNGALTVFNNTGLTAETEYFYTIVPFVWDGATASTYNYNLASPQSANDFTFSTTPDNHPSNGSFTVTGVSSTQINLAFDNPTGLGNSDGYIILRRQDGTDPTTANIQDGVNPATLAGLLPAGTTLAGTTTNATFNDTGLTPATQYNYLVLPYNSNAGLNAGTYNYKTGGTPVTPKNDFTFATEPSGHATGTITATPVSSSQINLSFNSVTTSGISNAAGYVVLVKSTAIVAADLVTLVDGAAPNSFGLFETIINSTSTNTYSDITGLAPNTTYHYAIIPFNRGSNDQTYNFLTTTGFATGSATTPDITATFTSITAGTAPVISTTILEAGSTSRVVLGFSVTSTGSQVINDLNFSYTGLTSQIDDEYIYRSTTASSLGTQILSDNSPDGAFSFSSVGGGDKTINSTPVYYYLVLDVSDNVTGVTNSITVQLNQGGVVLASGVVSAFSANRSFTFSTSQASDIILTGGTTNPILYRFNVDAFINDDQSNSITLADYQIRDGGAANDSDNKGMSITSIDLQVVNVQNLRRIALFNDNTNTEIAGTELNVSSSGTVTITFTPSSPITVNDNGTFQLNVRGTFKTTVTDGQSIQISVAGVTASNTSLSGFAPIGSWASTQTSAATNIISVIASKLVFLANPPATALNTNFSLTVRALDQNNNLDINYTGKADLTVTGGSGTLSGGAQSLSPALVAGQFPWTQLQINQAGTYNLILSDDEYLDAPDNQTNITDAIGNITITSAASVINQPSTLSLCYGGDAQTLGNIVITESDPAGFSAGGTFSLSLPSGFVFDQSVTTAPLVGGGSDISAPTTLSYPGANTVEFSFTITGTANTNSITITGLKIRRPHPGGDSPSPTGGSITRSGGTAAVAGVTPGVVLATVNANLGSPVPVGFGFTVQKLNSGDVDVASGETRFSQNSNAVRLIGAPAASGGATHEFVGSGVTFISGEYRFNPQSLAPGAYPITFKFREGSGQKCEFQTSKTFEIYTTNVTNLNAQYCNNDAQTLPMNVNSYLAAFYSDPILYPGGWTLNKFVFWNTFSFTQQDITTPANNIFDPKLALYQGIYSQTGTFYGVIGIWIGFIIQGNYDFDGIGPGLPIFQTRTIWQLIPVRPAPAVSFTLPKLSFCADETPVTLVGNPANTNSIGDDFFSTTTVGQGASIDDTPAPVVWSFNPQLVSGVTPGSPQTVDIRYTYRDPSTGCVGTSAPITVTVNSRPASVLPSQITSLGGITKELCQGGSLTAFETSAGPTYNWYSDVALSNKVGTAPTFTPPVPPFNSAIPGSTKFFVTQTIAGCESNKEPSSPTLARELSVIVNPTPIPPVPNFNIEYCIGETIDADDFQILGGTFIKWYKNGTPVLTDVSSPTLAQITTNFPAGLGIDNTVAASHTFEVTQTANGCEGTLFPTKINVIIKPLPSLTINSSADDPLKICTTGGTITFKGLDQGNATQNGIWSTVGNSFTAGALSPNSTLGTADLNTLNLVPDDYTLKYEYTNSVGCTNNTTLALKVLPKILTSINPLDFCAEIFVRLNNTSTVDPGGLTTSATITQTSWDFRDGFGLLPGAGNVPFPATNSGRTKGTYFSPEHKFSTTGSFGLQYTMTTSDGCTYQASQQLNISPKPNINFTWENVCRDGTTNTEFRAIEQTTPIPLPIANYKWNFNVNNTLNFTNIPTSIETLANPTVNYSVDGTDVAELIVTTTAQCRDTIRKVIYVVPKFPLISPGNPYNQDFNSGTDNWLIGGTNSSWLWGTLDAKGNEGVSTRGSGWDTNYIPGGKNFNNSNEQSWVLSRCFDFSNADRPVIALDIFSDSPYQVNGTVLQYNLTGNIENETDWITLGDVGQGINWYDAFGISNSPGNQSANDVGWTGNASTTNQKYNSWVRAIHRLDVGSLNGANNVVFRIAFASGNSLSDGFAFDNVFIGERTRKVLVENFTNSGATPVAAHNQAYQDSGTPSEVVKVQYHTPFPANDPINSLNPAMHNSRTAFYGITESKTVRIDGAVRQGDLNELYEDRVLTPSPLRVTINPVKVNEVVEIEVTVENISGQTLPTQGTHLFTTIVDQSVTDAALLSTSGNTEFVFVAKEMLPSPTGLVIPSDLDAGEIYTSPKILWRKQNGDAIAVTIQAIEGNNKNVFQAEVFLNPPQPDLVTGIEDLAEYINIYPNPANESFEIELPTKAENRLMVNLIDPVGRATQQLYFEKGEQTKTVNTQNLAQGVYVVQIGSGKTGVVRKKVLVVH